MDSVVLILCCILFILSAYTLVLFDRTLSQMYLSCFFAMASIVLYYFYFADGEPFYFTVLYYGVVVGSAFIFAYFQKKWQK
ncbi:hypothetical protein [Enterococcus alishanensis]|uniref:Uncharacterized protein n=1 Tax=Enterococcus alishanensis TaxID=1303817 RepID=A0ABS6TGZ5_9ENTE|nr:hypothetical protein [Enterococcus alishanensis]MBV7392168.1 hypothetical protein [Enterococcus alishanensis]